MNTEKTAEQKCPTIESIMRIYNDEEYGPWDDAEYHASDVKDMLEMYALRVAEAVKNECIIMAQRVHGTGPAFNMEAFKSIDLSKFLK